MVNNKKAKPKGAQLYPLAEVGVRFGLSAEELHRQAIKGTVELCVMVPPGHCVYNVDPASLQILNPAYLLPLSHFAHTRPSRLYGKPALPKVPVHAVAVSRLASRECFYWLDCPIGIAGQSLFAAGYSVMGDANEGGDTNYGRVKPRRPPVDAGFSLEDDEQWCFGIFAVDETFDDWTTSIGFPGYRAPVSLLINHQCLYISEAEAQRVLSGKKVIDEVVPEESLTEFTPDAGVVESGKLNAELNTPIAEIELTASSLMEQKASSEIQYPRADRFLRLEELMAKVGMSKSTIYNRLNPKHKGFDPAFPAQIKVGVDGMVGWLESDVEVWMKAKVASSREKKN